MPIENVTDVELEAYISANPTAVDTVFKPVLTKKEYAVLSKDERAQIEDQVLSGHVSKVAPKVEKLVKDVTGIDKANGEKYYKYQNRAMEAVAKERNDLKAELETLKSKSDLSKAERDQLEALTQQVKLNQKSYDDLKASSAKEVQLAKMENDIVKEMNSVTSKLIKDTKPGVQKAQELLSNQIFKEISEMAQKDSRGKIILVGADGKALVDNSGFFLTVSGFYEKQMTEAGFVDTGKKQTGAGGTTVDRDVSSVPGGVKNQTELMDWLRSNTMKGKSQKELIAEFDKYAPLLPA